MRPGFKVKNKLQRKFDQVKDWSRKPEAIGMALVVFVCVYLGWIQ